MIELIVYACPTGALADQLERYVVRAQAECGPNTAHRYMPHVTLTGFFHDLEASAPFYAAQLGAALADLQPAPAPPLAVAGLEINREFHGLLIESAWAKRVTARFAELAHDSPTRSDALRVKDWLHLSLAYGFAAEQHDALAALARELVDPRAPAGWELRLYERRPGDAWVLHESWGL
jgi:hypothetical protein